MDVSTCPPESQRAVGDSRRSAARSAHRLRRRRRVVAALAGGATALVTCGGAAGSWDPVVAGALFAALLALYLVKLRRVHLLSIDSDQHVVAAQSWSDEGLAAWLPRPVTLDPVATFEALRSAAPRAADKSGEHLLDRWVVTQMLWAGFVGSIYNGLLRLASRLAAGSSMGWLRRRLLAMTTTLIAELGSRSVRVATVSALAAVSTTGLIAATAGAATSRVRAAPANSSAHAVLADVLATAENPSASSGTYTVEPGDTLSAIAARFGTSVEAIAATNGIADPNLIYAGQVISIPSGTVAVSVAPSPPPAPVTVTSSGTASGIGGYSNPLRAVGSLAPERIDQGVDYSGSGPVYAIGDGVVLNTANAGWPDGAFISYELSSGPAAGDIVYVAEGVVPTVHVGQQVTPTTVVGTLVGGSPGLEMGWAKPPGTGNAAAVGQWNTYTSTAYGENFSQLLQALGAPPGISEGTVQGALPGGWPSW